MPSVDRYSCSSSTWNFTSVKNSAYDRKHSAVSGSAQPMTRRVASSTTTTLSTAKTLSERVRSSM